MAWSAYAPPLLVPSKEGLTQVFKPEWKLDLLRF